MSLLTRRVKVFLSGTITKPANLEGIAVTPKVKEAIEAVGGSVKILNQDDEEKKQGTKK